MEERWEPYISVTITKRPDQEDHARYRTVQSIRENGYRLA